MRIVRMKHLCFFLPGYHQFASFKDSGSCQVYLARYWIEPIGYISEK